MRPKTEQKTKKLRKNVTNSQGSACLLADSKGKSSLRVLLNLIKNMLMPFLFCFLSLESLLQDFRFQIFYKYVIFGFFFLQAIKNMRDSSSDSRNAGVRSLRISPDGQALAAGDRSGNVRFVFEISQLFWVHRSLTHNGDRDCNFQKGLKP